MALADGRRARLRDGLPEGASSEAPYHDLGPALGGAHLCEHDTNPLAMMEDHPDKAGNAVDLGGRPVGAWVAALQEAGALIAAGLPAQSAELGVALRRVIPVGFEPERHLSASYREAPGLIYLTLHPSALTLAEAIVHEVQHGKLNALSWLDPVLRNGRTTWTRSPVRPDERPLMGVLLAAHAFVPVAALHAGLATARHPIAGTAAFSLRRSEVLRANAAALDTLHQHADPTAAGGRLLADLQANHAALLDLAA